MLKKWHIHRLSVVVIILFTVFLVCYGAKDAAAFDGGVPISDIEMEETHGGFQMPNGNFLYFSMDIMNIEYYGAFNQPDTTPPVVHLPDDMYANLSEIEGMPGVGSAMTNVSGNHGFTNVGVIVGNGNTQNLTQMIDISLAFFEVTSPNDIKPVLSNWLHLAL